MPHDKPGRGERAKTNKKTQKKKAIKKKKPMSKKGY